MGRNPQTEDESCLKVLLGLLKTIRLSRKTFMSRSSQTEDESRYEGSLGPFKNNQTFTKKSGLPDYEISQIINRVR